MEINERAGNMDFHSLHANMYSIGEQPSFEEDDDEDEEELRQRNAELRNLLDNGFDDLLDNSDVEDGANKSDVSSLYQIPVQHSHEPDLSPIKAPDPNKSDHFGTENDQYLSSGLNTASELEILYNARGRELLVAQTALKLAKEEVESLKHQVAVLQGRGTQMGLTTHHAEEALVSAKIEMGDLKSHVSDLEANLRALEEDKMELKKNLEGAQDVIDSLETQLQALKHSNTTHQVRQKEEHSLEALRARFQGEVTRLQTEREKLSSALEERDRAYRLLEEKVASLTTSQERILSAKAEALSELQTALEQHTVHREQRERLQQALMQAAKERDELKQLNAQLQEQIGSKAQDPSVLMTPSSLSDSMHQLGIAQQESGRGLASKLRESQAVIKQLKSQVQSLSKELSAKNQRILDLQKKVAEQDKQAQIVKEQVEPLIARYQNLNTSQSEVERLQRNVQEAYDLVAKYQSQIGQKDVALTQKDLQIQQLESKCSKLSSEISEVKSYYVNVCEEKELLEKKLGNSSLPTIGESKTVQTDFASENVPDFAAVLEKKEKEWEQMKSELTQRLNQALKATMEAQTQTTTTPTLLDQSLAQTLALQHALDALREERDTALKECLKLKEAWSEEKRQFKQKFEEEKNAWKAKNVEEEMSSALTKIRQQYAQEKEELIAHYTRHIAALQAVQSPVSNASMESRSWEPFLQLLERQNPILAKDLRQQFLSLSHECKETKDKYRHLKSQVRDYRNQATGKLARYKADQRAYQAKCEKVIENLLARVQAALNTKIPDKLTESPAHFLERLDVLQQQVDTYLQLR